MSCAQELRHEQSENRMKELKLNNGMVALVDDDDYERLIGHRWKAKILGGRWIIFAKISLHQFIINAPMGTLIDHKNGDQFDNRRENLGIANHRQNNHNTGKRKRVTNGTPTSVYKGVSRGGRCNKRWRSAISIQRKQFHLGYFDLEIQAARSYDCAAQRYFGEFARLNLPLVKLPGY